MTFPSMNRRTLLSGTAMAALGAAGALGLAPGRALALGADASTTLIGAAWRGPKATDTHYAGVLAADWERKKLSIRYAVALPSRPHGLLPQADGGLLVNCVRPGTWLLRCDGAGKVMQQIQLDRDKDAELLSGHTVPSPDGATLYTTEINYRTGRGHIGVRDAATLRKQAEWDSGGIDPHQPVLDAHCVACHAEKINAAAPGRKTPRGVKQNASYPRRRYGRPPMSKPASASRLSSRRR